MENNDIKEKLASYIYALRPIIYINHFDFEKIDKIIFDVSSGYKVYEWVNNNITYKWEKDGETGELIKKTSASKDIIGFLKLEHEYDNNHFIVLKNINGYLKDNEVLSWLTDIAHKNMKDNDYNVTIFIISSSLYIPNEIEKYTTILDIPYPKDDDISKILDEYIANYNITLEKEVRDEITASLRGLSEFEIKQILNLAYQQKGFISLNLRKAIKIAEAVTPCVLWIDEIEKAFAGIGGTGGASDITTRLLGYILTWLQEKDSTVYVVATSNDITKLPAEFFRKGRFDELFRIELPNAKERKEIFELHLKKRNQDISKLDIISLLDKTEGYSGADIESIIQHSIERCFIEDCKKMETKDLEDAMKDFKCISVTFKDKLEDMKKNLDKYDMKYASKK
ncbi:AAA family ATPase [uncultured Brachyspira sp.]|uniref:AAA family ATPase n=1 Tax=uncultured Brachyspira sp. TaxID=221953 RepID=UPI0026164F32|nr:AAA family ATPase [uncultured Brachyspira sp.]